MNRAARQESPARSPGKRQPSIQAAQEHEAVSSHHNMSRSRRHLEGSLRKYTNLLQGWQSRFFVLDQEVSQLQYYLNEVSKSQRSPRGSLPLLGATVASSDNFPYMFTVQSTAGDFYKLRAVDTEEQELWMTQLQLCSRHHSDSSIKVMTPADTQDKTRVNSKESLPPRDEPLSSLDEDLLLLKTTSAATLSCLGECLSMLQHNVVQALNQNQNQNHIPGALLSHCSAGLNQAERVKLWSQRCSSSVNHVEPLRTDSPNPTHSVSEHITPKHSSCRLGRDQNHVQNQSQSPGGAHTDSSTGCSTPACERQVTPVSSSTCPSTTQTLKDLDLHSQPGHPQLSVSLWTVDMKSSRTTNSKSAVISWLHNNGQTSTPDSLDPNDETTDTEDAEEEDLGVLDDQRSIILHLLSQLKLGMDLTQVVLPTFILEKRSLLEMYANFMAHPDMFLSITSGCTAEERIIHFVEYYLTAFHEGRKGAVAKKPYNPVLGENFHCSWYVPRDCVRPLRTTSCAGPNAAPVASSSVAGSSHKDCYRVRFVAEQVSHHPPVSGFYCECKEKRMCVNTHVWTRSKFMGMSVGVSMVGEGVLYLLEHDEEYVFTLPCAYARSILTVPWVELGGKVTINCAKSGYSAGVTFHTKPFYGGKVHRITAEVKHNQTGNVVCKAQGEWNGLLEFSYNNGDNKVIDTSRLPVIRKKTRPLEKQGEDESRRLWQHVTVSLKAGNMDTATEHKHCLEERQRSEAKQRAATRTDWKPRYFIKEGEGWVYHNPLWKAH
ncbi:oxysterol-binding protein-related protein 10-like isoform X2 [Embiotoca jacksoni]|uniref:oxysterol-binding protein-related protein 10-like isoform X2 n=1 Tax=Embiotoca jacksoni TaxID=100190 RepID=UPI0037039B48